MDARNALHEARGFRESWSGSACVHLGLATRRESDDVLDELLGDGLASHVMMRELLQHPAGSPCRRTVTVS